MQPTLVVGDEEREVPPRNRPRSKKMSKVLDNTESANLSCRAELIFNARTRANGARPIKVLSECICDFRRIDWPSRWQDWISRQDAYLNLFLCKEHAKTLGLME